MDCVYSKMPESSQQSSSLYTENHLESILPIILRISHSQKLSDLIRHQYRLPGYLEITVRPPYFPSISTIAAYTCFSPRTIAAITFTTTSSGILVRISVTSKPYTNNRTARGRVPSAFGMWNWASIHGFRSYLWRRKELILHT